MVENGADLSLKSAQKVLSDDQSIAPTSTLTEDVESLSDDKRAGARQEG